jgi:hypothetical protein
VYDKKVILFCVLQDFINIKQNESQILCLAEGNIKIHLYLVLYFYFLKIGGFHYVPQGCVISVAVDGLWKGFKYLSPHTCTCVTLQHHLMTVELVS